MRGYSLSERLKLEFRESTTESLERFSKKMRVAFDSGVNIGTVNMAKWEYAELELVKRAKDSRK